MSDLSFPPLFTGFEVPGHGDPFDKARALALRGCDSGLVVYDLGKDRLRATIVLAPDVPLRDAMAMMPLAGVGFQNALGALAPPEVAVHLEWTGGIRVNGATCGRLRVASADCAPDDIPDWLNVGFELALWPEGDDTGATPDQTALYAEGCADVNAAELLEAWVRHTLVGLNRWGDEGVAPLHKDWRGLAHGIGEPFEIEGKSGTFLGVDEAFGLLLRDAETTHLFPLTTLLEDR